MRACVRACVYPHLPPESDICSHASHTQARKRAWTRANKRRAGRRRRLTMSHLVVSVFPAPDSPLTTIT